LRQSEVVFQHTKNLPLLFNKAKKQFENHRISAVAVSKKPRPKEDSYMPVFVPGTSLAESIAAILGIPVFYTTHQEGHIASGLFSSDSKPKSNKFLAVHLSGGTSEILSVKIEPPGYAVEKIGGTLDLHAGQLIDRIGVQMGLPFPAGSFFEALANKSKATFDRIPSSVSGLDFHLSGAEAEAKRRLIRNLPEEDIARAIEHVIASSLNKAIINAVESGMPKEVLIVGGVAQNQYIQKILKKHLQDSKIGASLYFAAKEYSGDNAFGVANIALNNVMFKPKDNI